MRGVRCAFKDEKAIKDAAMAQKPQNRTSNWQYFAEITVIRHVRTARQSKQKNKLNKHGKKHI